jgi:hypothetical protein
LPSDPAAYTWDEDARQFRDRWGRYVSRSKVRESLDQYLDKLQVEMHGYTEDMGNGSLSIGRWQEKMEGAIKRGHTAAVAIARGGWKQATAADWGKAGPEIRFQYARLNRFAKQLEGGLEVHGGTIARAGMYALAPTKTYESILRQDDIRAGFDLERRITHSAETCPECIEYAARGWRPAGELPDIGVGSSCLSRCRCTFERRRTKPKPPRIPEPEPLPEPPKTKKPRTVKPPEVKQAQGPPPESIAELRSIMERHEPEDRAREMSRYLKKFEAQGTNPESVQKTGMESPESLKSLRWGDITWRYDSLEPMSPMEATFRSMAKLDGEMPMELTRHTKEVTFSRQRSTNDAHWEKAYDFPGFRSRSTGGNGDIVAYNGYTLEAKSLAHEMAHNLAQARYGAYEPPVGSDYRKAMGGESPISTYAGINATEDFAESVGFHVAFPKELESKAPRRRDVITRILEEPGYGG